MKKNSYSLATYQYVTFLAMVLFCCLPAQAQPAKIKVLIGFRHAPQAAEHAAVAEHGGKVTRSFHIVPAVAAEVPQQALERMKGDARFTAVELDGEFQVNDAELDAVPGVSRIRAGEMHALGHKGTGVKVAVIDTGIDYNHPDLNDNYAGGWDFVNNDADPMDDNSHGTHVAGTIGAEDNETGVVGVAPGVRLYALKVMGSTGSGSFSAIISAIEWCIDHGIQVTNNSYGSTSDPGSIVKDAFDRAEAAGIVMVASAGNSGAGADTVGYPGKYNSTIAIAALNSGSDTVASFSSTGPAVELSAPGSGIYSTMPGGGYGSKSGTSMACPHAVGSAALLISAGMQDQNGNGRTNDEVRAALDVSARDLGDVGRDNLYGYGIIDLIAAVDLIGTPLPTPIPTATPTATRTPTPTPTPMPDFIAPSTPTNLSASGNYRQQTISWSPSSDNVGVTGYLVFRDGSQFAATSSTSATDSTVNSGEVHSYQVKAFDAAGNQSGLSQALSVTVPSKSGATGGGKGRK